MWKLKTTAAIATAFIMSVAGTAWYAYSSGKQSGMSETQTRWDAEVAAMALAQAAELERAMAKTAELQAQVEQITRSHRNEVNRIRREHSALVDSLRDRPEARAGDGGVPEGSAAGVGCTGAGLARPDAAFLAGFAADAARTQAALQACQRAYNEVMENINARD